MWNNTEMDPYNLNHAPIVSYYYPRKVYIVYKIKDY